MPAPARAGISLRGQLEHGLLLPCKMGRDHLERFNRTAEQPRRSAVNHKYRCEAVNRMSAAETQHVRAIGWTDVRFSFQTFGYWRD